MNFENKLIFDFNELENVRKRAVAAYNKLAKSGLEVKIDITRLEKIYSHWGKSGIQSFHNCKLLVYNSAENISVDVNNIVKSISSNQLIRDCNLYITKDYNFFKNIQAKDAMLHFKCTSGTFDLSPTKQELEISLNNLKYIETVYDESAVMDKKELKTSIKECISWEF